jgi:aspartate aminotransferase
MLQISDKGLAIQASPIRKLVPYANKAKARGIRVFHLNIGQPDIATPEIALEVVRRMQISVIEYTDSAGNHTLRSKLAGYYQKLGIAINEEDILITTGGSEAILFAFMSTLNEGDEIIIPEPYYANYAAFAVMVGAKVKAVTATIENNFALPPISEFEKLITPRTKGIVIINPNNPTGYLYSQNELEALAKMVKKHNLYLYSDEVYRRYCYDGLPHFSVMNIEGIEENAILFDSMSKRYSECGIRVGAIITRNKEVLGASLKWHACALPPWDKSPPRHPWIPRTNISTAYIRNMCKDGTSWWKPSTKYRASCAPTPKAPSIPSSNCLLTIPKSSPAGCWKSSTTTDKQ